MSEEQYETETPEVKADLTKRIIAVVIDGVIASIITTIINLIPFIGGLFGGLAGAAYFLTRDGLDLEALGGQSVGKKIMKLKVEGDTDPLDYISSIKRNITLGFVYLILPFQIFGLFGWIIISAACFVQALVWGLEIYKVLYDPEGKRIGDTIANTLVVDDE